jgi:hypothetical protein
MLDMPAEEVLERVEAAAALGDDRAERLLRALIEEEHRTGGLSVISRLTAKPYIPTKEIR